MGIMMRLKNYLKNDKFPKTKKFGFFVDNPGGEWLEVERENAAKKGFGSVTAGFKEFVSLPLPLVQKLSGKMGEKRSLGEPRVKELMASLAVEGIKQPIFINVEYDGVAVINEGNRRTLVAGELGWKRIPAEIRYYAGGERVDGDFHPDKIARIGRRWKK